MQKPQNITLTPAVLLKMLCFLIACQNPVPVFGLHHHFFHMELNNLSKVWFAFVKKLLFTNTDKYFLNNAELPHQQEKSIRFFLSHSLHRVLVVQTISLTTQTYSRKRGLSRNTKVKEKAPIGERFMKGVGDSILFKREYNHFWSFLLDQKLRLNITFHFVAIGMSCIFNCNTGSIYVKSYLNSTSFPELMYCGIQSTFATFPQGFKIEVNLKVVRYSNFAISFFYSTIDHSVAKTVHFANTSLSGQYHTFKNHWVAGRYNIQVSKLKKICVSMVASHSEETVISDGPGLLSPTLNSCKVKGEKDMCCATSFSIIIFTFSSFSAAGSKMLNFTANTRVLQGHWEIGENLTNYPTSFLFKKHCKAEQRICLIEISSPRNTIINISVSFLPVQKYWGSLYTGLAAFDSVNITQTTVGSICRSNEESLVQRNIYSSDSKMALLLYELRENTKINVNFSASPAACNITKDVQHKCAWSTSDCFRESDLHISDIFFQPGLVRRRRLCLDTDTDRACHVIQINSALDEDTFNKLTTMLTETSDFSVFSVCVRLKRPNHVVDLRAVGTLFGKLFASPKFIREGLFGVFVCFGSVTPLSFFSDGEKDAGFVLNKAAYFVKKCKVVSTRLNKGRDSCNKKGMSDIHTPWTQEKVHFEIVAKLDKQYWLHYDDHDDDPTHVFDLREMFYLYFSSLNNLDSWVDVVLHFSALPAESQYHQTFRSLPLVIQARNRTCGTSSWKYLAFTRNPKEDLTLLFILAKDHNEMNKTVSLKVVIDIGKAYNTYNVLGTKYDGFRTHYHVRRVQSRLEAQFSVGGLYPERAISLKKHQEPTKVAPNITLHLQSPEQPGALNIFHIPVQHFETKGASCCCRRHVSLGPCPNITVRALTDLRGNTEMVHNFLFVIPWKSPVKYDGSWNEAFHICKSEGTTLPFFNSREEQDALIAVLKSRHHIPVALIFIGLIVSKASLFSWSTVFFCTPMDIFLQ